MLLQQLDVVVHGTILKLNSLIVFSRASFKVKLSKIERSGSDLEVSEMHEIPKNLKEYTKWVSKTMQKEEAVEKEECEVKKTINRKN